LPVNDDAINEADNAGQHLNLQLGDKERRGINIDPHELGIEVLLDKTLTKRDGESSPHEVESKRYKVLKELTARCLSMMAQRLKSLW